MEKKMGKKEQMKKMETKIMEGFDFTGISKSYHENGQLWTEENWKDDKLN